MKETKVIIIDAIGRVKLSKAVRKRLGWEIWCKIDFKVENNKLVITKGKVEYRGTKKMDEQGQIMIPKETRSSLDYDTGDELQFEVSGESLVLSKKIK
ncbi:MAG: AbrB/MazE/SpoVT family DNA-binding domain-containing protein [Defluviitaleaceae bacterium]|nr:AbrB/MazE/SpoVT family DNA-binding domain-containing protein [Defluviitaleaceae bacterium]